MDKKVLMLLAIPLLVGCGAEKETDEANTVSVPEITTHNYFEVEEYTINWQDAFTITMPDYFVYYYSPTCSHCSEMKDLMIETALDRGNIFFVKSSEKDVIVSDISKSIGATTPEEISILGYPTVVEIKDKILIKNKAGKTQIKELLKIQ